MENTESAIKNNDVQVGRWAFEYDKNNLPPEELNNLKGSQVYMKAEDGIDENSHLKLVDDLSMAYVVQDNGDKMLRIILQNFADEQGFKLVEA